MRRTGGFTLLEVMVAMVIVATAAAITLTHMRTLLNLEWRYREAQTEVTQTLNRVALLPAIELEELRVELRRGRLLLARSGHDTPLVAVDNFFMPGDPRVPVDQAYTPFQEYRVDPQARAPVTLILPSLSPPGGTR